MGTSQRWRGPVGPDWEHARRTLTVSLHQLGVPGRYSSSVEDVLSQRLPEACVVEIADAYRGAFVRELRRRPPAFGLRQVARDAGGAVVRILGELDRRGVPVVTRPTGPCPSARRAEFAASFSAAVTPTAGHLLDAVSRRASTHTAIWLLRRAPRLRLAVEGGVGSGVGVISPELLCFLFRVFFDELIAGFLDSVISAQVSPLAPALPQADPTDQIVARIADDIWTDIPRPCRESAASHSAAPAVEVAGELVHEVLDRVAGVPDDGRSRLRCLHL